MAHCHMFTYNKSCQLGYQQTEVSRISFALLSDFSRSNTQSKIEKEPAPTFKTASESQPHQSLLQLHQIFLNLSQLSSVLTTLSQERLQTTFSSFKITASMAGQSVIRPTQVKANTRRITSPSTRSLNTHAPLGQLPQPKKRACHTNRYKRFPQFSKIPPEIRLKIWRYSMRPRVIRAEYQNVCTKLVHSDVRVALYNLDAGPVPFILQVNSESRTEALRFYSLIKAKLPVHTLARDGERLPPGNEPPRMPTWLENRIWINPSIDAFFFVNFPSTNEFMSYFRRISRPSVGGLPLDRPIRNIALVGKDVQRFRTSGRTDLFYLLCMEHKEVSNINIVLDNSNFREDLKPHTYSLWKVDPLPQSSHRGGGLHGGRELRENCEDIFKNFWVGKPTVKEFLKWKEWREKNKEWVPPRVVFKRIAKIAKPPPVKNPRVKKAVVVVVEIDDNSEEELEEASEGDDP